MMTARTMHGRRFYFKGEHCTRRAAERSRTALRRHWWYVHVIETEAGWYRVWVAGAKLTRRGVAVENFMDFEC